MEHLSFDPRQRQYREVHGDDDCLSIHRGLNHFLRCRSHFMEAFLQVQHAAFMMLSCSESAKAVLHDDHRAVDNQPEVDRAE